MLKDEKSAHLTVKKEKSRMVSHAEDISGVFAIRVMNERRRQGLSQERLAEYAEVSIDIIKRIENGMGAKLEDAYHISEALHVSLSALLPMQEEDRSARIQSARLLLDELET